MFKTLLPLPEVQVRSLIGELRSRMPLIATKKKKNNKREGQFYHCDLYNNKQN